jgi:serine/threonine protein kinase
MIMSSDPSAHHRLNQEVASKHRLLDLIRRPDFATLLTEFAYEWDSGHYNAKSEIFDTFNSLGWVGSDSTLSRIGILVYGRMAVHFNDLESSQHGTVGNYKIIKRLRSGKNSVIFIGEHVILGFNAILKFVRPGASDDIERSLKILATGRFHGTIVMPTDLLKVQTLDITGRSLRVSCLVFPLVEGQSFNDFLNEKNNHLNSHVVIAFIKQIGAALEELERIGAYHGDLHSHNILVSRGLGGLLEFKLLDISYDAIGSMSSEESQNKDLDNFKQHVWRILS